eukprot:TRINITY_DN1561_c0_g1_i2.p1 TRINITY_DN1561_c0_g1~~TRINITY_DN1561_c0_g1_i2.p1  ORF type:complete len:427 (-),score=16.72 TRINITY_DN1561_c0_g1_i2:63-1343(-)
MPLTGLIADAFGAAILAIAVLVAILSLTCVCYVLYFQSRIKNNSTYGPLQYFNLNWIPRLVLLVSAILWCLAEIFRPHLLRNRGWALHFLSIKWQHNLCRIYLLWNLGLMEPLFFLILAFLLCKSLRHGEKDKDLDYWSGNRKPKSSKSFFLTVSLCSTVFVVQLFFNVVSPSVQFHDGYRHDKEGFGKRIPSYFTRAFKDRRGEVFCAYPLFSVIVHGVFACLFITYFLYIGTRLIKKVINRVLQRRIYWLIFSVVVLLPLRVLFLGFSSFFSPGRLMFEAFVLFGFFAHIVCVAVGVRILVHRPVADSLAVKYICDQETSQQSMLGMTSIESSGMIGGISDNDEGASNTARQSLLEGSTTLSIGRDSDSSAKVGSISFRTMLKDVSAEPADEVNLFVESTRVLGSPGSPPLPGKPMISFQQSTL